MSVRQLCLNCRDLSQFSSFSIQMPEYYVKLGHIRYRLWSPFNLLCTVIQFLTYIKGKGHPCTGTEALYRPYGP
jgi:hypothetical protein